VQQNVPAWLVFAMFFVVIPISSILITERQQGTLQRLASMGLPFRLVLLGKLLPFFVVNQIQAGLMVGVGMFGVPLFGGEALVMPQGVGLLNWWLVAAAVSLAAVACALLVASVARTTQQATIVGGVSNILMGAIGGIMVPKFMMPAAMQTLAEFSPMAWGLDGFHTVMLRHGSFADLLPSLLPLLAFAAAAGAGRLAQPTPNRMSTELCLALNPDYRSLRQGLRSGKHHRRRNPLRPEAPLQLDSLDALQVSMAIKKKYGLRLPDSKETRRILSSVANLAEHLDAWLASRADLRHVAPGLSPPAACSAPVAILPARSRGPVERRMLGGQRNARRTQPSPTSPCRSTEADWMVRAEHAIRQVAGQLGPLGPKHRSSLPRHRFRSAISSSLAPPSPASRHRLVQPPDRRMDEPERRRHSFPTPAPPASPRSTRRAA
jgi:hypothetical protein